MHSITMTIVFGASSHILISENCLPGVFVRTKLSDREQAPESKATNSEYILFKRNRFQEPEVVKQAKQYCQLLLNRVESRDGDSKR